VAAWSRLAAGNVVRTSPLTAPSLRTTRLPCRSVPGHCDLPGSPRPSPLSLPLPNPHRRRHRRLNPGLRPPPRRRRRLRPPLAPTLRSGHRGRPPCRGLRPRTYGLHSAPERIESPHRGLLRLCPRPPRTYQRARIARQRPRERRPRPHPPQSHRRPRPNSLLFAPRHLSVPCRFFPWVGPILRRRRSRGPSWCKLRGLQHRTR
jgi:hypothetical protein